MMRSCVSNKDIKEDIALKIKENASDNIMEIFLQRLGQISVVKKKGDLICDKLNYVRLSLSVSE
jgi:hypothetical protein